MKRLFFILTFLLSITLLYSQPANNNCASATIITVNSNPICTQTTASATVQGGEYIMACTAASIDQTVWYKFTATQSNMSVWVDNSTTGGCHIATSVYNTSVCFPGAGNVLSCKDNIAPIDMWHHLTGLTIGNTYLIQILYNAGGPCGGGQTFCISVIAPNTSPGYLHPTVGLQNTFLGGCMVNDCTPNQYYDNGGSGGNGNNGSVENYSNNVNLIYRTFCPNAAGNCVRATVNFIDLESGFDPLRILNGPTQNSTILATVYQIGNGTTYTSTEGSGCLSFRFQSDATITRAGWNITISCVACVGPNGIDNNDCSRSTLVCSNEIITGASTGPGIVSDGCSGCNISENYSNWYNINIFASGTLLLTIDPSVNTDDYDFAIYGPNVICSTLGTPVRCSYAATPSPGNTGLGNGAVDISEDVLGDSWVAPLSVVAGETYYLMINKWDPTPGNGFTLFWTGGVGGSGTATLSCTLPISLLYFTGYLIENNNIFLEWVTLSEINNDYFTLEKSIDGFIFNELINIPGNGNTNKYINYDYIDCVPFKPITYYKLKQTDYDGQFSYSNIVGIKIDNNIYNKNYIYYNILGQKIDREFNQLSNGIYIRYDGYSYDRVFKN